MYKTADFHKIMSNNSIRSLQFIFKLFKTDDNNSNNNNKNSTI
jgi:hypothetical protein